MDIKKLGVRAISGIVYCLIIIGACLWGKTGVLLFGCLLAICATIEFAKLCKDFSSARLPDLLLDVAGCVCLCFGYLIYPIWIWMAIMLFRFVEQLYVNSETPLRDLAHSMLAQIYIGVPLGLMAAVANLYSPMIVLALFVMLWINDTGAFLVGSAFGRHKLFERISPKKTWEGFIGGMLFCIISAIALGIYFNSFFGMDKFGYGIPHWIGFGLTASVFGTWGDLVESMVKRTMHVKDSGNVIPGHGGLLDRIDSFLLAMPAIWIYLMLTALLG